MVPKTMCLGVLAALAATAAIPARGAVAADLFVSGTSSGPDFSVKVFNGSTGLPYTPDGAFTSGYALSFPRGVAFGPDANLYVSSEGTDSIVKYNGTTGTFISEFVPGGGDLSTPRGLTFSGGKLYVAGLNNSTGLLDVLRYDATTGAPIDKISDYSGSLAYGVWDVTANSSGKIFFTGESTGNVIRFDPVTLGVSEFISSVGGTPHGLTFGPDGNLYVGIYDVPGRVLEFDGTTGAPLGTFVASGAGGLSRPEGLEFGPEGFLYVASADTNNVLRYNGTTGSFFDVFATIDFPNPFGPGDLTFQETGVPEPASLILLAAGAGALLMRRRGPFVSSVVARQRLS